MLRSGSVIRITFRRPKRPYRELLLPALAVFEVVAAVVVVAAAAVVVVVEGMGVVVLFDVAEGMKFDAFDVTFLDLVFTSLPLPGSAGKLSF